MTTPSQVRDVNVLYERLRALPWPALAKSVGDFGLYESLLAGCADRLARGKLLNISQVPVPDEETRAQVTAIRQRRDWAPEEVVFLEYFDLLEEIRLALGGGRTVEG